MKYDLVISGMIRDVHGRFWDRVAERLGRQGMRVAFLAAMDEAAAPLAHRGTDAVSVPAEIRRTRPPPPTEADVAQIEQRYGLLSLRHLYMHEMYSTERYDEARLRARTVNFFRVLSGFLEKNEVGAVIQETGGWIECQAMYRIARAMNLPHLFMEPGPLRNTTVFARNSTTVAFERVLKGKELGGGQRDAVARYVEAVTSAPALLVPHKDRAYYRDATLLNVVNARTFGRLLAVLRRKALVNKFDETFSTRILAARALKSVVRRRLLSFTYRRFPENPGPFIYFPLHMPFDMQILVRAPQFFRQEFVVEMLSRALPQGVRLFVKEHPVSIGWLPYGIMRGIAKLPNVVLLHPGVGSHEVIRKAGAVVTINSKVGFESLAYYKPVVTLGASFYRGHGATVDVQDLAELAADLRRAMDSAPDRDAIDGLLATVLERCHPGDLYDLSETNLDLFEKALRKELEIAVATPSAPPAFPR